MEEYPVFCVREVLLVYIILCEVCFGVLICWFGRRYAAYKPACFGRGVCLYCFNVVGGCGISHRPSFWFCFPSKTTKRSLKANKHSSSSKTLHPPSHSWPIEIKDVFLNFGKTVACYIYVDKVDDKGKIPLWDGLIALFLLMFNPISVHLSVFQTIVPLNHPTVELYLYHQPYLHK